LRDLAVHSGDEAPTLDHNGRMLLLEIAEASEAIAATPGKNAKISQLAALLGRLRPEETAIGVAFLTGTLRQRQIGVGYAALRSLPPPARQASLTLIEVDHIFEQIGGLSGSGSQGRRQQLLTQIASQATEVEQRFLWGLLLGELRQGALAGVMVEAVALAASVPIVEARRALMVCGDLGQMATVAFQEGRSGLNAFRLEPGRPLLPMLAQPAPSLAAALERTSPAALEWKLDGVRVQLHRFDDDVRVFTRSLDEITERVPELVETARGLPVRAAALDGEAIALDEDRRPYPFQLTARRLGSRLTVDRIRSSLPLTLFLFDVLHLDGEDLLNRPGADRAQTLARVVPEELRVPRLVTDDLSAASEFLAQTLSQGHEGVLVKSLASPYEAGSRGAGWLKVKPRHTLDLVVLAAEWGHGRRRGYLSNLHLGAIDPRSGGFVMLGKTFKGLTDELLAWQTQRCLELERERDRNTVYLRPELVVEIAFDGVQSSPRYPGGVALRFARVLRYRPDKRVEEADTIDSVRALHRSA
jgi:DNA ligase 1